MKLETVKSYLNRTETETRNAVLAITEPERFEVPAECNEAAAIASFDALDFADEAWLSAEPYPVACFIGDNRKPSNV